MPWAASSVFHAKRQVYCLGTLLQYLFLAFANFQCFVVSDLTTAIHIVEGSRVAAITAVKVVPETVALTRSAIEAAQVVPHGNFLIELIKNKKLTKVDDIWNSFLVIQKLPEVANKMRDSAALIQNFVTGNAAHWHNTMSVHSEVLSEKWDATPVGTGMTKIQSIIKTEL